MKWKAMITVTLKEAVFDPQGTAVEKALTALNYRNLSGVRVGKYMEVMLADVDEGEARRQVEEICRRLLANPVMEDFAYTVVER